VVKSNSRDSLEEESAESVEKKTEFGSKSLPTLVESVSLEEIVSSSSVGMVS